MFNMKIVHLNNNSAKYSEIPDEITNTSCIFSQTYNVHLGANLLKC